MNLAHDFFSPFKDSITSCINWRALNSGQLRTGIWSHGMRQLLNASVDTSIHTQRIEMNISKIRNILNSGDIRAEEINPMISALEEKDLGSLSQSEKKALCDVISSMLVLTQDPSSGAHLDNPEKAELLLASIDLSSHNNLFKHTPLRGTV
jgi:hypothetical protein